MITGCVYKVIGMTNRIRICVLHFGLRSNTISVHPIIISSQV